MKSIMYLILRTHLSASSWSNRARIYCWMSLTTKDFLKSSKGIFRKPLNILEIGLLWRRAVQTNSNHWGNRWWWLANNSAIVLLTLSFSLLESLVPVCGRSKVWPSSMESTNRNRQFFGGSNSRRGNSSAFFKASSGSLSRISGCKAVCISGSVLSFSAYASATISLDVNGTVVALVVVVLPGIGELEDTLRNIWRKLTLRVWNICVWILLFNFYDYISKLK